MSVKNDIVNLLVNINGNKAQNDLNNLRIKASGIRQEMAGLKKGTAEYIAKSKELAGVTSQMDALKKQIGITALNQRELNAELKKLNALKSTVPPLTKEFHSLEDQIKAVKNRLNEIKGGSQGFSSFFSKFSTEIKGIGIAGAGFIGLQAIKSFFQSAVQNGSKVSDNLADIRRVSGLTAEEVQGLNDQLRALDTRTSTQGLQQIAIVAGKLGVQGADDIFQFTKAVDMLTVALGDELGDANQITTTLGKILNVFDGKVNGDNITRLGNAFVELANAGVASGAFIADFDQRLSGVAKSAGIGLGELSGLGAGIEELGGRVESSSTAVQKLLITIAGDLPKAAKIAGMSTKEFSDLYNADATEALLRYSEGLVKNKNSFAEVTSSLKDAGEEGARTIETITKLGTNTDLLRSKIDIGKRSLQESSAITEAFSIKNETFGATLEKISKRFEQLATNSKLVKFLQGVANGFLEIISPAKTAVQQFDELNSKVKNLDGNIAPLLQRYDELKKQTKLSNAEQAEMKNIVGQVAAVLPSAITEVDAYGRAIGISTSRVREYINVEKDRLRVVNGVAVSEISDQMIEANKRFRVLQQKVFEQQNPKNNGFFNVQVKGEDGVFFNRKSTEAEVRELYTNYQQVIGLLKGLNAEKKRLNGEALEDQIKSSEAQAKADEDARKNLEKSAAGSSIAGKGKNDDFAMLRAEAEKFYSDIRNLKKRTDAGDAPGAQEIEQAKQKYAELLARAKEFYVKSAIDHKRYTEEEKIIEEALRKEIDAITKKYNDQKLKEQYSHEYEKSLTDRKQYSEDLKQQLAQDYANQKITKKQFEAGLTKIEADEVSDRIIIAKDYAANVEKASGDVNKFQREQAKLTTQALIAENEARKKFMDAESVARLQREAMVLRKGSEARLDADKKAVAEKYRIELEGLVGSQEQYNLKYQEWIEEVKKLDEEFLQYKIEQALMWANTIIDAVSRINTVITNRENAAFAKEKQNNDRKRNEYKKMLDGKLISQGQYDKKMAQLQEEQDARERAIKRKQAAREKAVNLMTAIVNTSSAVAEALPNIPLSIIVGGLGLLEINEIAKTKLPELGKGDWIRTGDKHSDKSGGQLSMIERGEAVMSAAAMEDNHTYTITGTPAQITSRLNSQAGGKAWAGGAMLSGAPWLSVRPSRISPDMPTIMQTGGANFRAQQREQGADISTAAVDQLVAEFKALRQDVANWPRTVKGDWVYKDFKEAEDLYNIARSSGAITSNS